MVKYVSEETCKAIQTNIKEDVHEIKTDLRLIRNNHLMHVQEDINFLKENLASLSAKIKIYFGIMGTLSSIIISALIMFLLKMVFGG